MFTLDVAFPIAKRFTGMDGKMLEIGCHSHYNLDDCRAADIDCDRYYFVDPHYLEEEFPVSSGHLLRYKFSELNETWNHKFRFILDFGVLGFQPHKWNITDLLSHIDSYSRILEPGGFLFLKMDGWQNHNHYFWPIIRERIEQKLVLVDKHAFSTQHCNNRYVHFWNDGWNDTAKPYVTVDLGAYPNFTRCDTYLFGLFFYPGSLLKTPS